MSTLDWYKLLFESLLYLFLRAVAALIKGDNCKIDSILTVEILSIRAYSSYSQSWSITMELNCFPNPGFKSLKLLITQLTTIWLDAASLLILYKSVRAGTLLETLVVSVIPTCFLPTNVMTGWSTFYVLFRPLAHYLCNGHDEEGAKGGMLAVLFVSPTKTKV